MYRNNDSMHDLKSAETRLQSTLQETMKLNRRAQQKTKKPGKCNQTLSNLYLERLPGNRCWVHALSGFREKRQLDADLSHQEGWPHAAQDHDRPGLPARPLHPWRPLWKPAESGAGEGALSVPFV